MRRSEFFRGRGTSEAWGKEVEKVRRQADDHLEKWKNELEQRLLLCVSAARKGKKFGFSVYVRYSFRQSVDFKAGLELGLSVHGLALEKQYAGTPIKR